jgi:hypothetical protein
VIVAPSNPNVIYVGSGEGLQRPDLFVGDGIYNSIRCRENHGIIYGLNDATQIGGLAVDPKDENKVFVAALGHPYGPNEERGRLQTLDGGKNMGTVLYKDENTGAIQVTIDPNNSNIVFCRYVGRQTRPMGKMVHGMEKKVVCLNQQMVVLHGKR